MGQEEYKHPKVYFKEKEEEVIDTAVVDENPAKEKVKLRISLEDCISNTNYKIKMYSPNNDKLELLFETMKSKPGKDNIIDYDTTYSLTYYFEKEQKLIFKIEINEEVVNFETTLGHIVGSTNSITYKKISKNKNEKIKIQANKVDINNKNKLKIHFKVNKEKKILRDSFHEYQYLFKITSSEKDIYRSEIVSSEGYFRPAIIPIYLLIPSFNIQFYNVKGEVLMSFFNLSYEKMLEMNNTVCSLYYKPKKLKKYDLLINAELMGTKRTFLDYIKEGMQIHMGIAIDFSKFNESLHKIYENKMNRYEEAIKFCGDIVAYYDNNQLFPVWGLGAENIPKEFNKMCFPINFNENPNVEKIDGVLAEYKKCLNKITLSEKAQFSPVIKNFIEMIESNKDNDNNYYILLLLTGGKYDDREKTIDSIVKASKLPMSIIIVGLYDLQAQTNGQFDIVYMIDATNSMGIYLRAIKDQCNNISNELKNRFKDFDFKFGGVFYRDPIDCPNEKNEWIDLTDDILSLRYFISCLKAIGGGDEAEDWAGGYELAINKINWRNGLKLIIHICDADSHGKEFTNKEDHHPNEGIKIPPLLQKCIEKQIKVIGFNINNGADISFNECKKIYDNFDKNKRGLYKFNCFEETENLAENFKEQVIEAATFAAMVELDGDSQPLIDSKGQKWERDIVQFVPYDKYKDNPRLLAEQILEEIPTQVVQYYNNKNIKDANKDGFLVMDDYEILTF